jgi:hypothetical protein
VCSSPQTLGSTANDSFNVSRFRHAENRFRVPDRSGKASKCPSHRYHAASVFLEGDRALKIKRAVRFPYLDYSTLAKWKAACDEEMKVNGAFRLFHSG